MVSRGHGLVHRITQPLSWRDWVQAWIPCQDCQSWAKIRTQ